MSRACLLDARVQRGLDAAIALDGAQLGPGAQLALAHRAQQVCGEMGSGKQFALVLHFLALDACRRREGERLREGSQPTVQACGAAWACTVALGWLRHPGPTHHQLL